MSSRPIISLLLACVWSLSDAFVPSVHHAVPTIGKSCSTAHPSVRSRPALWMRALPPGWTELYDEASKRPYYLNQASGTTQWEMPKLDSRDGAEKRAQFTSGTIILHADKHESSGACHTHADSRSNSQ